MRLVWTILLSGAVLWLTPSIPAIAQRSENSAITVFPAILEIPSVKGEISKSKVVITNNSDKPLPLTLEVTSLIPADAIIDLSKRSQFDASRWVDIAPKNIALDANESKTIDIAITIPDNATAGEHYAEISVKELRLETEKKGTADQTILPQVKVPVFIQLEGETKEELLIESGDKFASIHQLRSAYTTAFTVANTGNTHLLPTFTIQLAKDGKILQRESFVPGILLPNTTKSVRHSWTPDVPIGRYSISIEANYGDNGKTSSLPENTFVIFPFYVVVFSVFVICIGAYLFIKRKRLKNAFKALTNNIE